MTMKKQSHEATNANNAHLSTHPHTLQTSSASHPHTVNHQLQPIPAQLNTKPITQTLPYSLKNPHPISQTPSPPHSATFKHHSFPILQPTPFQRIPNLIPTLMTCPSLGSNSTQAPTLHAPTASLPHSYTPRSKSPNTIATPSPNTTSIPSSHAPSSPPPRLCLINRQEQQMLF